MHGVFVQKIECFLTRVRREYLIALGRQINLERGHDITIVVADQNRIHQKVPLSPVSADCFLSCLYSLTIFFKILEGKRLRFF